MFARESCSSNQAQFLAELEIYRRNKKNIPFHWLAALIAWSYTQNKLESHGNHPMVLDDQGLHQNPLIPEQFLAENPINRKSLINKN